MDVLSLFTGAGGLDLGLELAGFRVAGCLERDLACRATIEKNTDWKLAKERDIAAIEPEKLLQELGLEAGEVALLAGGPPCQPFSKAGQWRTGQVGKMSDPRADTLHRYFEVLDVAQPEVMVLENVKGLVSAPKPESTEEQAVEVLATALDSINKRRGTSYAASIMHLEAADFGVPQRRQRVFVVAHRDGLTMPKLTPTHRDRAQASLDATNLLRWSNAWDAIGDLDAEGWDQSLNPSGRWAELLPSIPEGRNYLWHTERQGGEALFGWRRKYWSFLLKLAKDRPSWTLQASPGPATGPFHWRSRQLSVREMARLQTFPDEHEFEGGYRSSRKQIGNAVPVALGELLGLEIRRHLFKQENVRTGLVSIPQHREPVPDSEPLGAIPEHFLSLRGSQSAHPGHGKGPGALARDASRRAA